MNLFTIQNSVVKPQVETLLISPFKEIWERDVSPHKDIAIKEFSYIEFMCSPKKSNPFSGYDITVRENKIVANIFKTQYVPDSLVLQAIEQYNEFFNNASPALSFLRGAQEAARKLKEFLKEVNPNARNDKGMPVYKPKEISSALMDTFSVVKTLDALQDKVEQEIYETTRNKANREINHFEKVNRN